MKKRILIIDDDSIYRKIIQKLLCPYYSITLTDNSEEAFTLIQQEYLPDLIIADFNLPGVTGTDMLLKIRQQLHKYNIPILVISGMDDDDLKHELLKMGISEYITKPIERKQLKDTIAHYITS